MLSLERSDNLLKELPLGHLWSTSSLDFFYLGLTGGPVFDAYSSNVVDVILHNYLHVFWYSNHWNTDWEVPHSNPTLA